MDAGVTPFWLLTPSVLSIISVGLYVLTVLVGITTLLLFALRKSKELTDGQIMSVAMFFTLLNCSALAYICLHQAQNVGWLNGVLFILLLIVVNIVFWFVPIRVRAHLKKHKHLRGARIWAFIAAWPLTFFGSYFLIRQLMTTPLYPQP